MITNSARAVGNGVKSIAQSVASGFWTVFYFFYFLAKGKPEWKCEDIDRNYRHKSCCVDAGGASDHEDEHSPYYQKYANCKDKEAAKGGWFSNWSGWFKGSSTPQPPKTYIVKPSLWSRFKSAVGNAFSNTWMYTKRIGRWFYHQLCRVGRGFLAVWKWLFSWIRPVLTSSVPSQALPATPKPFTPQSSIDSPTYNKVFFAANAEDTEIKLDEIQEEKAPVEEKEFYHAETVFPPRKDSPEREVRRELSVPPPAPPPPPAKPIRVPSTLDLQKESTPVNGNGNGNPVHFREPKEPLMKLPQDVMAELSGAQRMRQERGASAQREMTQSCHPDMPEWKEDRFDRSATATPFRASSVGPTMRKLEQVVSRLEDSDENEAQFVFRPKQNAPAPQPVTPTTPHASTGFEAPIKHVQAPSRTIQEAPISWRQGPDYQPAGGYQLGKSVFSPVREAETMRDQINRRSAYDSRPVTPATSLKSYGEVNNNYYGRETSPNYGGERPRARTVGPYGREPYRAKSPFTPSAAYSNAPFTSHTTRRSRTPSGYDRGANFAYDRDSVTQGSVDNVVRQWPPVSNATGVPVEKDHWISDVLTESQDGLITTMARRVVEQRTSDNWKWRDEQGALVDEKNQNTWKGELDTVLRDGPNQGRHWSRRVEQLPGGDTRFQDVSRQYSDKYVVESIIRNY